MIMLMMTMMTGAMVQQNPVKSGGSRSLPRTNQRTMTAGVFLLLADGASLYLPVLGVDGVRLWPRANGDNRRLQQIMVWVCTEWAEATRGLREAVLQPTTRSLRRARQRLRRPLSILLLPSITCPLPKAGAHPHLPRIHGQSLHTTGATPRRQSLPRRSRHGPIGLMR